MVRCFHIAETKMLLQNHGFVLFLMLFAVISIQQFPTTLASHCLQSAEMFSATVGKGMKTPMDSCGPRNHTVTPCSDRPFHARRYREIDGRCNHREGYGRSMQPVKRYLPAQYQDRLGHNHPRTFSVYGSLLPSPRLISTSVHTDTKQTDEHTLMIMQLGQFVDHDITSTPVPTEEDSSIKCCNTTARPEHEHNELNVCLPITIPEDDPDFDATCMEFVRSEPAKDEEEAIIYPREQLNTLTSFLDGSAIYGNDHVTNMRLRTFKGTGALLKVARIDHKDRLPHTFKHECLESGHKHSYCQDAGDKRVNEHPFLGSLHTLFHLFHNDVARQLVKVRRQAKGQAVEKPWFIEKHIAEAGLEELEDIYQETKKIVSGVLQKIVYCDWLPIVLGQAMIDRYSLGCEGRSGYDTTVDPRIANSFLSAAFRFGHSLIPNTVKINNKDVPLQKLFMVPDNSVAYFDENLSALVEGGSQPVMDRFISSSVSKHLFESDRKKHGVLDLTALNVQRGRDHGVPGYVYWLRHFGLEVKRRWEEFGDMGPQLSKLYRSVHDMDLFCGGLLEPPTAGGMVGPTFAHIIASQFHDLKFGDRFFFTTNSRLEKFTNRQLAVIKSITMADVICQCSEMAEVQGNVFYKPSHKNPSMPCNRRPDLDLTPWV